MTIRNSTGLKNAKFTMGQTRALSGGTIELRTLTQPTSADDAAAGVVLGIITKSGDTHTAEVRSYGTVQLTAGGAGNTVTGITINSIEILGATITYDTSLIVTAALVVAQINRFVAKGPQYTAVSDGAAQPTITITIEPGFGTTSNSWTVTSTVSGFSKTDVNTTGGVAAANGLSYEGVSSGVIAKNTSETWTLTWLAAGTIGHFRMKGSIADADASSATLIRKDGSVGVSGADMTVSSTTVTTGMIGTTANVTSFTITEP